MISKDTLDNMSNEISKSTNSKYKATWIGGGGGGGNDWATTGNIYQLHLYPTPSSFLLLHHLSHLHMEQQNLIYHKLSLDYISFNY